MSVLDAPYFKDDETAREHLEAIRWPDGPFCPHCGEAEQIRQMQGKSHRPGLYNCRSCRKPFTVTVGTLFERSHVPLHKWFQAVYLLCSSKKGISTHQLHRMLGVTYKTAWFMTHRIREAMREGVFAPMGLDGGVVEVDETFIGHDRAKKPRWQKKGRGYAHKHKIMTLVERGGRTRSIVVEDLRARTLVPILREQIDREARVITDEAGQYKYLTRDFAEHHVVRHGSGEYGRSEIHTNTIEGYFSIFKRGMKGVYQHCGKRHLQRYLAEFDFRYNQREVTDLQRTVTTLRGIEGKRLMYRDSLFWRATAHKATRLCPVNKNGKGLASLLMINFGWLVVKS